MGPLVPKYYVVLLRSIPLSSLSINPSTSLPALINSKAGRTLSKIWKANGEMLGCSAVSFPGSTSADQTQLPYSIQIQLAKLLEKFLVPHALQFNGNGCSVFSLSLSLPTVLSLCHTTLSSVPFHPCLPTAPVSLYASLHMCADLLNPSTLWVPFWLL